MRLTETLPLDAPLQNKSLIQNWIYSRVIGSTQLVCAASLIGLFRNNSLHTFWGETLIVLMCCNHVKIRLWSTGSLVCWLFSSYVIRAEMILQTFVSLLWPLHLQHAKERRGLIIIHSPSEQSINWSVLKKPHSTMIECLSSLPSTYYCTCLFIRLHLLVPSLPHSLVTLFLLTPPLIVFFRQGVSVCRARQGQVIF